MSPVRQSIYLQKPDSSHPDFISPNAVSPTQQMLGLSIDVAKVLFDFGDEDFGELIWDVRSLVFEYAAKKEIPGLIFTWAYSHPDFQPYLNRIAEIMDPSPEYELVYTPHAQRPEELILDYFIPIREKPHQVDEPSS